MQELLSGKKRVGGFNGEWKIKKIGDIAKVYRGASPRPIESPIWFSEKSSIGWVRISDVTKSIKYLKQTTQKLSDAGVRSSRFIEKGNLIMSICATVGRPILTELDTCIHDGFVVFTNLQIERDYLYYYLASIEGDWSKHGQTGSQMNLNTYLINSTFIHFPNDKDEQRTITTILADMDNEIEALEQKLHKYKMIKQGMMQVLLTGKIRLV
jgi:type I restriction enzyme S subunit